MFTPENAELMKLMGMGAAELDIPLRYSMFEEVSKYFSGSDAKQKVLKILAKTNSKDGLEAVWRYVRLENEKKSVIESLDPQDFEDPISDELKEGVLTMERMKQIEDDMARKETKLRDKIVASDKEESENRSAMLQKAVTLHQAIKQKFNVVREINQTIEKYG
ncbi:MAG: hypothetical protein KGL39_14810 [Patescibacteria group bacterium]|nr:hypothetical protein [Patescibacteria group bacterium]